MSTQSAITAFEHPAPHSNSSVASGQGGHFARVGHFGQSFVVFPLFSLVSSVGSAFVAPFWFCVLGSGTFQALCSLLRLITGLCGSLIRKNQRKLSFVFSPICFKLQRTKSYSKFCARAAHFKRIASL